MRDGVDGTTECVGIKGGGGCLELGFLTTSILILEDWKPFIKEFITNSFLFLWEVYLQNYHIRVFAESSSTW